MRSPPNIPQTLLFAILAMSCSKPRSAESSRPGASVDAGAARAQVGDRAVVENATATFVEGTVTVVIRDRARVHLINTDETIEQALLDLYLPSSDDAPAMVPVLATSAARDAALRQAPQLQSG